MSAYRLLAGTVMFTAFINSQPQPAKAADAAWPDFDRRLAARPTVPAPSRDAALSQAQARTPGLRVDFDDPWHTPSCLCYLCSLLLDLTV